MSYLSPVAGHPDLSRSGCVGCGFRAVPAVVWKIDGLTPAPAFLAVYARSSVIVFFVAFVAFVLLGFVKPVLILFGLIDLIGAIWTALAVRSKPSS